MEALRPADVERLRAEKPAMMAKIMDQLVIEFKLKTGAETMLQLSEGGEKGGTISREQVEIQLTATKQKIAALQQQLDLYKSIPDAHPAGGKGSTQRPADDMETLRLRSGGGGGKGQDDGGRGGGLSSGGLGRRTSSSTSIESNSRSHLDLLKGFDAAAAKELVARIGDPDEHPSTRIDTMNVLLKINRHIPNLSDLIPIDVVVRSLRTCLAYQAKEVRASALRVLRHLATEIVWLQVMVEAHIDVFVMRAMTRDQRYDVEREQALKLIRKFIDTPCGAQLLPQNLARVVVAVAEQTDDKFRSVCLETLCELAIRNMSLLTLAGGTKIIFGALLDGPRELTDPLVRTVLFMLDSHETRCYLRPSVELEMIMSQFTDAYSRGPANEEKLTACAKAVTLLFKSWTGIIYLCLDNKRAIRSIVESLRLPYDENRKILLEMLFEIFQIDVPKWYPDFVSARSRFGHHYPMHEDLVTQSKDGDIVNVDRKNLVDHYLSIVLMILIDVGLLEVLVELLQHENKYITTRVTILVGEMLELCNRLLPMAYGTRIQSLPTLFRIAADFHDELGRHQGTLALTYIDGLHKSKERMPFQNANGSAANRRWASYRSKQQLRLGRSRQVESVKIRMGIQIDDVHFRIMLGDLEKVLGSKDYTKWNWDTIMEFIQGPLLNPKRFDEALKSSKVVRRITSFFRPMNYQFSNIKRNKGSAKYIRTGCELMKTLLATSDGIRFLSENKLFAEIADCLGQLDPVQTGAQAEIMFSKERMATTLTGEYFKLLGICTRSPEGIRLLDKFRMFSLFYRLTELRSRDDLVKAMILSMDYTRDNHPRVLLSKVMTSGYKHIRLASTNHLRAILQLGTPDFSQWGIQLLVTQLYDPSIEVCERAVMVLDQACNDRRNLESVVNLRPSLDHLGQAGNPLLLRFLSTTVGFHYLDDLDYIHNEMDYWFEVGNDHYVIRLELSLSRALSPGTPNPLADLARDLGGPDQDDQDDQELEGTAPPHFYGELARTPEGAELLSRKGHFEAFADLIRRRSKGDLGPDDVLHLKGVLWAVGNIAASTRGLPFLIEEDLIRDIVEMARSSPYITIKGTCYYVLGLVAKTPQGVEILEDFGWETVLPVSNGQLPGLCIPKDPASFLKMPVWKYRGAWPEYQIAPHPPDEGDSEEDVDRHGGLDPADEEILACIANMSNHILANAASKSLSKLRNDNPPRFARPALYLRVLRMLSVYHFRLTARRFVHELFDRVVFDGAALERLDRLPVLTIIPPSGKDGEEWPIDVRSDAAETEEDTSSDNDTSPASSRDGDDDMLDGDGVEEGGDVEVMARRESGRPLSLTPGIVTRGGFG